MKMSDIKIDNSYRWKGRDEDNKKFNNIVTVTVNEPGTNHVLVYDKDQKVSWVDPDELSR